MPDHKKNALLAELARRGVYQALGIYVAVAWGSIEILITAADRFGWPGWLGDAALILFLTALPFVVLLAWAFDLTGSGLQRMEPGSLRGKTFIAVTLTVVLGLSATWFVRREDAPGVASGRPGSDRPVVAVMPFEVVGDVPDGELLALSFTDEVINRINAHPDLAALDLQTVSHPLMAGFLSGAGDRPSPMDYTVRGRLRPAQSGIELRVRMTDAMGLVGWEYDTVLPEGDADARLELQRLLASQVAAGVGISLTGLDYCEPSRDERAVELYYEANRRYSLRGAENVAQAALMLEEAVRRDPDYARAMDLLAQVYDRFPMHVLPEPGQYGKSPEAMTEFLESNSSFALAREALARCPSLASSYFTVQINAPVEHTFADALAIIEESLRREPGNLDLRSRQLDMLLKMGHLERAGATAQEMVRRDPLDARNIHALAWIARLRGRADDAMELEIRALELGYVRRNAEHLIACDLVVSGDAEGLQALLGEDWVPDAMDPVDPRRTLAARSDDVLRSELVTEYEAILNDRDSLEQLRYLVGHSCSPIMELGVESLAAEAMNRFNRYSGSGAMPAILWHARYRDWWRDRLLSYEGWNEMWRDFWSRVGPPDGCSWDGESLDCDWPDSVSS